MSSAFGCNSPQKNSLFKSKMAGKQTVTPEDVTIVIDKCQVITALVPFQTKQASAIRTHMHQNILDNGQKIFIYRSINGWTNIALDSTESAPKLTCDPITTLKIAHKEFNACTAVGNVYMKWKGTEDLLPYEAIDGMEGHFDPLPEDQVVESTVAEKTDAEMLADTLDTIERKVDSLDTKIGHIISIIELAHRNAPKDPVDVDGNNDDTTGNNEEAGSSKDPATPQTGKRARKTKNPVA